MSGAALLLDVLPDKDVPSARVCYQRMRQPQLSRSGASLRSVCYRSPVHSWLVTGKLLHKAPSMSSTATRLKGQFHLKKKTSKGTEQARTLCRDKASDIRLQHGHRTFSYRQFTREAFSRCSRLTTEEEESTKGGILCLLYILLLCSQFKEQCNRS